MSKNQIAFIVVMDSKHDDDEIAKTMELVQRMKGVEIVEPIMKYEDDVIRNDLIKLDIMRYMNIYFKGLDIKEAVGRMRGIENQGDKS